MAQLRISRSAVRIAIGAIAIVAAWLFIATPGQAVSTGAEQIFRGKIVSCYCGSGKSKAVACTAPCTGKGITYVLADTTGSAFYQLSDQKLPALYPSRNVIVVGYLERSVSIHVDDIVLDLPAQVSKAKTVAVVCDACPRAMAKVSRAALGALLDWNRFTLSDDPRHADLIFLFSANPYLGDYLTRDGPDKRPVAVDTVYLNLVDPHTGQNLWGDYRTEGWLFVSSATHNLVTEVRQLVQMDQDPSERHLFVDAHLARRGLPSVDSSPGK
jgi:hypothetical protein